jgi:hypothetical protein
MSAAAVEVRQCPKCQQPAVVLVMSWQHETWGVSSGQTTREYRCQQCGAWETKRSSTKMMAYWILGVLLAPAGFGLLFLWLAWRDGKFDVRVPLVPGAPEPRLQFPGGPPKRTCAGCSGVARAVQVTKHTHRGITTGIDYVYECAGCKKRFTTENVLGHVTSFVSVLFFLGITAAFFLRADSAAWRWGGTVVAGLSTGVMGWKFVERVLNRFRHRELVEHVL